LKVGVAKNVSLGIKVKAVVERIKLRTFVYLKTGFSQTDTVFSR
jgi:hypothetical protein